PSLLAASSFVLIGATTTCHAQPLLRCYVSYAGSTTVVESPLTEDPYKVLSTDIAGRFRFKAVMIGKAQHIDYIKLYAYFQTRRADV
ncbi:hypothetical protein ABTJ99_20450, partial [Acinetobacter baumannii]